MNKAREQKIIVELAQRLHYNIFGCYAPFPDEQILRELYVRLACLVRYNKVLISEERKSLSKLDLLRIRAEHELNWQLYCIFDDAAARSSTVNLNTIADMYINYKIQSDPRYEYRTHPYPKRLEFLKMQETASCVYREIKAEITRSTRKPSRGTSGNL